MPHLRLNLFLHFLKCLFMMMWTWAISKFTLQVKKNSIMLFIVLLLFKIVSNMLCYLFKCSFNGKHSLSALQNK